VGSIDGGALFGKALVNEGVEKAFILSGGHIMLIFYGTRAAGIAIIDKLTMPRGGPDRMSIGKIKDVFVWE
jgi:hypothetical protein